jgi:CRP-like cAMP-binding protein
MALYPDYELPLLKSIPFSDKERLMIYRYLKVRHFKKKEKILQQGETESHFNFLHKGLTRQFYIYNNREINTQFTVKDDIVCSAYSYFSRTPSTYNIEAVEPTTLLSFEINDMEFVLAQGPNFIQWGRLLMNQLLFYKEEREKELLTYDATNRLQHFIDSKPELFSRLSQVHIASYLNIQPETFSKLKSSIQKIDQQKME